MRRPVLQSQPWTVFPFDRVFVVAVLVIVAVIWIVAGQNAGATVFGGGVVAFIILRGIYLNFERVQGWRERRRP